MMLLVGREKERKALDRAMASPEAELVALYGRRRVGKTFLVRQHLGDDVCFELTGMPRAKLREQLGNFSSALGDASGSDIPLAVPASWADAFGQLIKMLQRLPQRRRKRVVFFDELPWLAGRRSGFLPAFEHFWNSWATKRDDLVVVVCGSAASWMLDRVLNERGGLYNRVTKRIRLDPFTLKETEAFLRARGVELSRYQVLEIYMALGGVPHYLKEVELGESAAQTIDRTCFSRDGLLRNELSRVYASLFERADRHLEVVKALASKRGGLTRNELLAASQLSTGGTASQLLEELEESGFVLSTSQFGYDKRDAVYRIADEFTLFHLYWIEKHRGRAEGAWLKRRGSPAWRAWSGITFEGICLKHAEALKRALGIAGVETVESTWQHRPEDDTDQGAQIDLLINRRDACINLCEMKFSEGEFVIDKAYAENLRNKRDTFRRVTQTKKSIFLTLVTTFGVRANKHRTELAPSCIEMDALFE